MCSKVKDFLTDDDFINYALGVTPDAEEAKAVLLAPADATCDFSLVEKQNLKDRIVSSIKDFSNILQLDQIEVRLVKVSKKIDAVFHRHLNDQVL